MIKKKILKVYLDGIKYQDSPIKATYSAYVIGFFGVAVEKVYQNENELCSFQFIIADFPNKKDFIVIISGAVKENGEILIYKSINIEQGKSKKTLVIVLIIVLLLICFVVGSVLFYNLYLKKGVKLAIIMM